MNQELIDYIKNGREKKLDEEVIKSNMIVAGWDPALVEAALKADLDAPAPPPPPPSQNLQTNKNNSPIAVVHNVTTRGLEYIIMFLAMGVSALALGFLLHSTANSWLGVDAYSFFDGLVPFATSALIVALPIFIFLFLRLKKAELTDTSLRQDPSRKRAIQLTLVVTFLIGIFNLIGYITSLLNSSGGYGEQSTSEGTLNNTIHALITVSIAGAIFAYYWIDSHRKEQQ